MDIFELLFIICALMTSLSDGEHHDECEPTQYLETGKSGVVECRFQEGFYAVSWYTQDGYVQRTPLLRFVSGNIVENLAPGQFDIHADGSLIINNVTLLHEHTFVAAKFQSQGDDPVRLNVKVVVLVKPSTGFPLVEGCHDVTTSCYLRLRMDSTVTCYIEDARPAVSLKWVLRTFQGELNISSQSSVVNDGSLFTTRTTTRDMFDYSSFLSLIVCKADDVGSILSGNESVVFAEKESRTLAKGTPIVKYVERDDTLQLPCSEKNISLIVWKKADHDDVDFHVLLYAAFFESVSRAYSDGYYLQDDGSLTVPRIQTEHEGVYGCIFEAVGNTGDVQLFNVNVIVPSPPAVHGCTEQHYCVLKAENEGILKCSVTGIRPRVRLQWVSSNEIEFFDHDLITNKLGDVYDVLLTSRYRIETATTDRLTVECRITGTNITVMLQTAQFDFMINGALETTEATTHSKGHIMWVLVLIVPLGFLAAGFACLFIRRAQQRRKDYEGHSGQYREETIPMFRTSSMRKQHISAIKNQFIFELKTKYQDLYDAVQPIPYLRDRLFCVDKVFVEGGIEYLEKDRFGGHGTWIKLTTYHDIVKGPRIKSSRLIIEGEPGYGKSTLSLQFAYDWCNKVPASYMKTKDILILLQLRQLEGVTSIYRAIKQFLLPKDSKLVESEIEYIFSESSSVVLILDGFDEYPDQDDENTDVINIIGRKMFQQFDVILTTRTWCLPKDYPPTTKRIRLTGFDDNARNVYIRKAVVGDDLSAASKIKQRLKENPILGDLCQVPLLFVMFAHISHENEQFQKFNTVTSFLGYMISCFHSHLKNKMKDDNVKTYELDEHNHEELDKLAFEGLSGKDQSIVWRKEYVCERLGQELYDHYVRLGILVEDEVLDIGHDQNAVISGDIQYKIQVRFYHKLFCEWYAAHYLSDFTKRDDVSFKRWSTTNIHECMDKTTASCNEDVNPESGSMFVTEGHYLKYLDPLDLQYVYRFACGLDAQAADKIIKFFRSRDDASRFVILCMLEQGRMGKDALENIHDLCSRDVYIYRNDSLLLQRSTLQLLEIASINEISISRFWLGDCYSKVEKGAENIHLKSNICVPVLNTLKELVIEERGREMTLGEVTDIFKYASVCGGLHELRFYDCLLPQTIKEETLAIIRSKQIQVFWRPDYQYVLNLASGRWEDEDEREMMADKQYQEEAEKVRRYRTDDETPQMQNIA